MQRITPHMQHEWLQQLVGEWIYEVEAEMGPDAPSERTSGVETVRSLGGLWTIAEGNGEMPGGGGFTSVMTLGFEPSTGRFTGTFVASMMTWLWIYDGELDPSGRALVLQAEGPGMAGDGKLAKYRDVIEILGPDRRTLTSHLLDADGNWQRFMTAHYRRGR